MERNTRIEEELFPFYALDALTEEERTEVEQYVAANSEAGVRLAELALAAADLSAAAAPVAPSPAIKAGLMARIEAENRVIAPRVRAKSAKVETQAARRRWWSWAPAVGFAAALLALIIAGGYILGLSRQMKQLESSVQTLQETIAGYQADLEELRIRNDQLHDQLQDSQEQLAAYLAPGAITVALGDISGEHPDAVGALTLNPDSGSATLSVANLPVLDNTKTYQAWLIVDGTPVSAGTFDVDDQGSATHAVSDASPGSFDGVGVSIEPAGGSDQPTSDQIVLFAGFSS